MYIWVKAKHHFAPTTEQYERISMNRVELDRLEQAVKKALYWQYEDQLELEVKITNSWE